MRVNADSLLIRAAATSTSGTLNDLTTDLIMANNNNNIAGMPIPTEPVKRVCYADGLTVWASGVNIPDLEVSINNYLEEITAYLKDNSLLISTPKSSVTLPTPDTHQAKINPRIFIENSHLPLVKCPRILGVYLDPPYRSTSTASMWQREYQVGTTSLRPWHVLHGDNKRKHY